LIFAVLIKDSISLIFRFTYRPTGLNKAEMNLYIRKPIHFKSRMIGIIVNLIILTAKPTVAHMIRAIPSDTSAVSLPKVKRYNANPTAKETSIKARHSP